MQRLVNMRSGPIDNGFAGSRSALVAPGAAAEFNGDNPAVKIWLRAGYLMPEGAVLASKAAAMADAPTRLEVSTLRSELARRDALLEEARRLAAAKAEESARVEAKLSEMAAAAHERDALRADLAAAQARVAELENVLASATDPSPAAPTRARRQG